MNMRRIISFLRSVRESFGTYLFFCVLIIMMLALLGFVGLFIVRGFMTYFIWWW